MNAMPAVLKDSHGSQVRLGRQIGKGGEGAVFEAQDRNEIAIKLYWNDKAGDRKDKIGAMVAAAWSKSNLFVAYPIDALYTPAGAFAGFTMRRIAGHKPVHLLYSPSSRKLEFNGASFRFLIRAALNVARAVASVHTTDCVIGDVNHSGFLVSENATITLIDSDSFQVVATGKSFLCQVGTPEYTPPELQNSHFSGAKRTRNHDNFGLAILLFQLLFMGRHPYSGRFNGQGDMPLERAIAEFRFAYSARRTTGMAPPPNAPLLSDFTAYVSEAFEIAFGPDGVQNRPTPERWVELLNRLEGDIQKCSTNPAHDHVQGKSCPWCRMELAHPGFVAFTSKTPGVRDLPIVIDTSQVLALITSIKDPGPVPDIHSVLKVPGNQAVNLHFGTNTLWMQHGAALGISVVGFLAWQLGVPSFVAILLSGLGAAVSLYPDRRASAISETRRQAEQAWDAVRQAWSRQSGNSDYLQVKSEALSYVRDLNCLPTEEKSQLQQLEINKQKLQLERHLERHLIKAAKIRKVGSARKTVLASFGIETAADIERQRIAAIQGFGPALVSELLSWRASIVQKFVFNANEPISSAQIAAVRIGIANKKVALDAKLRSTLARLQQVATFAADQRSSLNISANAAFVKFKESLSAEHATHPIFTRVAKIVSISCLGIMLLNLASTQHPSAAPPNIHISEPVTSLPSAVPVAPQAPPTRQQASTINVPDQASTPAPVLPSQVHPVNDPVQQSAAPAQAFRNAAWAPSQLAERERAFTPPSPTEAPGQSQNTGQPSVPPETATPRLSPNVPADATQIQQRLFDLGYLQTPPDGKWGQRSARALQEFRAARGLQSDVNWNRRTEDALLSSPIAERANAIPLFAGGWRPENDLCGSDRDGPPLRITRGHAETAAGRCDFDTIQAESESAWRVRAKCSANGETWQANIQLRVTGPLLTWESERGRAQYLRCK
jgi:DNA-binding helix-hairpin-helix protein with protein kinase domain